MINLPEGKIKGFSFCTFLSLISFCITLLLNTTRLGKDRQEEGHSLLS